MRVAIRDRGRTWGVLCLHREASESPFDHKRRRCGTTGRTAVSSGVPAHGSGRFHIGPHHASPGVVILDDQFVVSSLNGAAATWLDLSAARDGLPIAAMIGRPAAASRSAPQPWDLRP